MGLPTDAIIDRSWARSLRNYADGRTVHYWINDEVGRLDDGTRVEPISRAEARLIRQTMAEVDSLTGLRLVERRTPRNTEIDFYRVGRYGERGLLGKTTRYRGWFEITWENRGGNALTRDERRTITHEIGHAFGLDHPFDQPFSRRFDTNDTIMSYNRGSNTGFTRTDVAALQDLWGAA
ncbi:MAG: hypothetical protein FJ057_07200 [Cyanobacteria bacterium K_DeepCast_0m_m1_088]|nr:hypothetical protein [Cyanobacteria bacterium K_DeepCast_0m_m1_088]